MTNTEIQTLINTAKCCLGDLGDKIKFKAEGGIEYSYTFLMAKLLTLYIFTLENYLTLSCTISDFQLKAIRDHINRICGCATTTSGSSSSTSMLYIDSDYIDNDYID